MPTLCAVGQNSADTHCYRVLMALSPCLQVFLITLLQTNWFVAVTNILGGVQVVSALTGIFVANYDIRWQHVV